MEKKNHQKGAERASEGESVGERKIFLFCFLFTSFSDLRKSDCRFLSGLKAKLIYA